MWERGGGGDGRNGVWGNGVSNGLKSKEECERGLKLGSLYKGLGIVVLLSLALKIQTARVKGRQ